MPTLSVSSDLLLAAPGVPLVPLNNQRVEQGPRLYFAKDHDGFVVEVAHTRAQDHNDLGHSG